MPKASVAAIVDALVDNGAYVAIVDIDTHAGTETAEEIQQSGGTCLFVEGNVSDAAQMETVAEQIATHFGKIQILVNNAGINTKSDRVPIHQYNLRGLAPYFGDRFDRCFHNESCGYPLYP